MQIIRVLGALGSGASHTAHHLAVTAYPQAIVFDTHRPGENERDADLKPRNRLRRVPQLPQLPKPDQVERIMALVIEQLRGLPKRTTFIIVGAGPGQDELIARLMPYCDLPMIVMTLVWPAQYPLGAQRLEASA